MHRRGRAQFRGGFLGALQALLTLALLALLPAAPAWASASPADEAPPTTVPIDQSDDGDEPPTTVPIDQSDDGDEPPTTRPVVTVSEFFPDDRNLSECVGLVEKPGCGSEARGGWRQAAVFVALAVGLGVIAWRISVGLRRNRPAASDSDTSPPAGGRDATSRRSP